MHRALVIRTQVNFCRIVGVYFKFNENDVIIVNKKTVPFVIEFMVLFYRIMYEVTINRLCNKIYDLDICVLI